MTARWSSSALFHPLNCVQWRSNTRKRLKVVREQYKDQWKLAICGAFSEKPCTTVAGRPDQQSPI